MTDTSGLQSAPPAPAPADEPTLADLFALIKEQNAEIAELRSAVAAGPTPSQAEAAILAMSPEELQATRDALDLPTNHAGERVALV